MLKFKVDYKPTPLKRPRLTRIGGRPVIYDASKKEKKAWLALAAKFKPDKPFTGPLCMHVEFYFPRPKNHYRTGKYNGILKDSAPHIHSNMPDIDNLSKFILDAMNEAFYDDDRQVVELNSHKEYINDKNNTTGYTIVTVTPYVKKSELFKNEHIKLMTSENMKSNVVKNMFSVPDSSSESI